MTAVDERSPGFTDRTWRLRNALRHAEFTDDQQAAIHHLAYWLDDRTVNAIILIVEAARVAEWKHIIDYMMRGGVYRGTARIPELERTQLQEGHSIQQL